MRQFYEPIILSSYFFGRVCKRRKLKVNGSKSKVMRCTRLVDGRRMNVTLDGEVLEEVDVLNI